MGQVQLPAWSFVLKRIASDMGEAPMPRGTGASPEGSRGRSSKQKTVQSPGPLPGVDIPGFRRAAYDQKGASAPSIPPCGILWQATCWEIRSPTGNFIFVVRVSNNTIGRLSSSSLFRRSLHCQPTRHPLASRQPRSGFLGCSRRPLTVRREGTCAWTRCVASCSWP